MTPQTKAFAAALPAAEYVEIAEAEHEMLMERNADPRPVLGCV